MAKVVGASDRLKRAIRSGDPEMWAAARDKHAEVDLSGIDLANASLADFDLSGVDLSNADLSEADLTAATLETAKLDGADLTSARLMEVTAEGTSFAGASLDEAKLAGAFVRCDFSGSTWEGTVAHGCRFSQCNFAEAEVDLEALVGSNRFDRCTFGDRDDIPEELRSGRPGFLRPLQLDGERYEVRKLSLWFKDEKDLVREAIGAATVAGTDPELVAFLRDGDKIYVGIRPESDVDELEEWIRFEPRDGGLGASELAIDPTFEAFLEELVLPMCEAAGGDLDLLIEQDLEGGGVGVTEILVKAGDLRPVKQSRRSA